MGEPDAVERIGSFSTVDSRAFVASEKISEPEKPAWKSITKRAAISYVMGIVAGLCCGTVFSVSAFSDQIKESQGFTQSQTELIGALGNVGANFAVPGGLVFDLTGTIGGALFGGMGMFFGFFLMYLVTSNRITTTGPGVLAVGFMISGIGSQALYTTQLSTNVQNLPARYRGFVVGSLAASLGLSATIFTGLYSTLFNSSDVTGFFLFLSITLGVVAVISAFILAPRKVEQQTKTEKEETLIGKTNSEVPTLPKHLFVWNNLIEKLKSRIWWLLFLANFCGTGSGYLHINNVGNMIKSLNNAQEDTSATLVCVTLISVFSATGRLSIFITDHLPVRRGWYYFLALVLMVISQLLNALVITSISGLYITTILIGLAYGMIAASLPTIVSEVWGPENFGSNWGWTLLSAVASTYPFNIVAGKLYDHQIVVHTDNGIPIPTDADTGMELPRDCVSIGTDCYRGAFYFAAGMCVIGAVALLWVIPHTKIGNEKSTYQQTRPHSERPHEYRSTIVSSKHVV